MIDPTNDDAEGLCPVCHRPPDGIANAGRSHEHIAKSIMVAPHGLICACGSWPQAVAYASTSSSRR
jgi:hypothetical protein